jgi:hypothetical protein
LVGWVEKRYPALLFDREAVLFGATTHDIGKTVHVCELSGPGAAHEQAGRTLLLGHGVSPELARFAATHALWTKPSVGLEDLLVSLADKIWKNKRVPDLEDLVVARLSEATGRGSMGGVHRARRGPLPYRRRGRRTLGVPGVLPDPRLRKVATHGDGES